MSYRVFIGYSGNHNPLGDAVALNLKHKQDLEVNPWTEAFPLGVSIFDGVLQTAKRDDFGVFAFTPEDFRQVDGVGGDRNFMAPNIVLELGVFAGARGKQRAFLLIPKGHEDALPADLQGVNHSTYDPGDLGDSVDDACAQIKNQIDRLACTDCHFLLNKKSGLSLDVLNFGLEDGNPIIQWPCHGGPNQLWSLEKLQGGWFKITSRHSGKCLEVEGGSQEEGAPVVQGTYNEAPHQEAPHQQWFVTRLGDAYQIKARHSGRCLAVQGKGDAREAHIVQRRWQANNDSFLWLLADPVTVN